MEDYTYTPRNDKRLGYWRMHYPSVDAIQRWITEFGGSKSVVHFLVQGKPNDVYYEELAEEIYWGRSIPEDAPNGEYETLAYAVPTILVQTVLSDVNTVENWINTILEKQREPGEHWLWDSVVSIDWVDV